MVGRTRAPVAARNGRRVAFGAQTPRAAAETAKGAYGGVDEAYESWMPDFPAGHPDDGRHFAQDADLTVYWPTVRPVWEEVVVALTCPASPGTNEDKCPAGCRSRCRESDGRTATIPDDGPDSGRPVDDLPCSE